MESEKNSSKLSANPAESAKGFQDRVKQVLDAMKEDKFSELTSEIYEQKKCFLTENLTKLSNMFNELSEKYADLQNKASKNHPACNDKPNLIGLQIQVSNLNHVIKDRDSTIAKLGNDVNFINLELVKYFHQVQSYVVLTHVLHWTISAYYSALCGRDIMINELNTTISQYVDDMEVLKAREIDWETDFDRLRKEVAKKRESVDELGRQLEATTLEKDRISSEYELLKVTRLDLSAEAKNGLTERVAELEREVETLKAVITVRNEEKREMIRQLASSLEHYKSVY